jgi:xanthine dehydrogenase small subunit
MSELFPEESMLVRIERTRSEGVEIEAPVGSRRRTVHLPVDLQAAVQCREEHPSAVVVSGATDVGFQIDSLDETDTILSLSNVVGMDEAAIENGTLVTGGSATWSRIEEIAKDVVPEYHRILLRFGSPQIRRVATIGGNIASASPIADGVPFLMVMGAEVELVGRAGARRVDINDFYLGDQRTVMMSDELIARVVTPLPSVEDRLRLYKVSKRRDLDIAAFTAGIRIRCEGDRILSARVAFGGVASKVCRLSRTEAFLVGKAFEEEVFLAAGRLARDEINPRTDVRGTAEYRRQLSERILGRFFHDCSDVDTKRFAVA